MSPSNLDALRAQLTKRDYALLADVEKYRLLTTRQVQRQHFDQLHPTALAAARACTRALSRLRQADVLRSLERRIGGARAGSAGFIWYLGPAGERVLHAEADGRRRRHNYREPSRHFVEHTLAITELATQLIEAARDGQIELLRLDAEPSSWQTALSTFGTTQVLKPDLRIVTASAEYEDHKFIEVDMASEHLPVVARQCLVYQAHRATGRYEAEHGLFPAVLWVTPTEARAAAIRATVANTKGLDAGLFRACTAEHFLAAVASAPEPPK